MIKILMSKQRLSSFTTRCVLWAAATVIAWPAVAATYTLPGACGTAPFNNGCSVLDATCTCAGSVTISQNNAVVGSGGANLVFTGTGSLTVQQNADWGTVANPVNVTVTGTGSINLQQNSASYGNFSTTSGNINVQENGDIVGNLTSTSGTIDVANNGTVTGNVTAPSITGGGTVYGNCSDPAHSPTCNTASAAPLVTTLAASGISATGATLNGTVTPNQTTATPRFNYGTTTAYGTTVTATPNSLAPSANSTAITYTLSGLTCGTTYQFRATASNTAGTTNGNNASFTTSACPTPTMSIAGASTTEGDTGTKVLNFTVTQTATSGLTTSATYALTNGTATGGGSCATGVDFVNTGGPVTIAAGSTTGTIPVTICGDTTYESDETFTVTLSSPSNATLGTSTATGTILNDDPLAFYTLDDQTWNDSSGNDYNATVGGLSATAPTFSSTSPALGTSSSGTCGYRTFVRSDKTYIALPANFPNLGTGGTAFTITAWIRTTDNTKSGQRILIDDEHNSSGYGFSLGDGGDGKLRFFSRGTPSVLILDTANVITNGVWYFVAAVADVPNKTKHIYAFNAAGTLLSHVSSVWTEASFGVDNGIASIGGETNASGENTGSFGFAGNLDEIRVYGKALSQAELAAVETITRTCPTDVVAPGLFNACEVTSPKCVPTALPTVTYAALTNKSAGQSFNLDAVALLSGGTLKSTFAGSVQVDLLANTSSGVAIGSDNCPVSQTATIALGSKTFAAGRVALTGITVPAAYNDIRLRFICLASVCGTDTTVCSTGNFATTVTGPHHLEIQHSSGTGLTCAASSLTIKACADGGNPCTAYTGGVTGTLTATGTPTVNWDGATGGAAGAGFVIGSGASSVTKDVQVTTAGTVVFGTTSLAPGASNATTCNFGSPSCTFTAGTAGFLFSNSKTGNTYTIPTQVSGTATPTAPAANAIYLRAVQASTTNAAVCTPAIISQNNVGVTMSYGCNNPAGCQSGNLLTVNATAVPAAGGSVSMNFDVNGASALTLRYDDVGLITVNSITPVTGGTAVALSGSTNSFVVKPHHFDLSGIQCSDGTNNPGATTAAGTKFCKAGENFSVTATARNALNAATGNFGQESPPETVRMTPGLVGGLGLTNNPAVSGSFGGFSSGVASGSGFYWGDVGIITLTPGIGDSDYLGAGDVSGTASGNVGRFYPYAYTLDSASITNRPTAGCVSGCTFTYIGEQDLRLNLVLTARNKQNSAAQNYASANSFAKLTTGSQFNLGAYDGSASSSPAGPTKFAEGARLTGFLGNPVAEVAPAWSSGNASIAIYSKLGRVTPEYYAQFKPGIRPVDTDGVTLQQYSAGAWSAPWDIDTDAVAGSDHKSIGTTEMRFGRLRVLNSYGSELLDIRVPLRAEFYNGTGWSINAADSSTSIATTAVFSSNGLVPVIQSASPLTLSGGLGTLIFNKTLAAGSFDLAFNLNAATADTSCNATHGGTPANKTWLQGFWAPAANCGGAAAWAQDPGARVKLGSPKAPYIYLRERY